MSLTLQSFVPTLPSAQPLGFATGEPGAQPAADPLGGFGAVLDALLPNVPIVGGLLKQAGGAPGLGGVMAALLAPADAPANTSSPAPAAAADRPAGTPVADPPAISPRGPDPRQLVADLADLLAAVETALDAGEEPNPQLMDRLGRSIDALAGALGLPIAASASAEGPATLPALPGGTQLGASPQPGSAGTPLPLEQLAERVMRVVDRFAQSGGGVGAKLAALATALADPAAAPAILTKLGLEAGGALAAEVFDLPAPTPPQDARSAASSRQFAAPALRLPVETPEARMPSATAPIAAPGDGTASDAPRSEARQAVAAAAAKAPADTPAPLPPETPAEAVRQVPPSPTAPGAPVGQVAVRLAHAAYQPPQTLAPQINLSQLAVDLVSRFQQGASRFQIRLDPPELGRIEVRMDVDRSGAINARLTVEKSETLDLLQRDQRQLERALQQAGLESGKTSLEFSLRQQTPFERQQGQAHVWAAGHDADPAPAQVEPQSPVQLYRAALTPGGVNIFV